MAPVFDKPVKAYLKFLCPYKTWRYEVLNECILIMTPLYICVIMCTY